MWLLKPEATVADDVLSAAKNWNILNLKTIAFFVDYNKNQMKIIKLQSIVVKNIACIIWIW